MNSKHGHVLLCSSSWNFLAQYEKLSNHFFFSRLQLLAEGSNNKVLKNMSCNEFEILVTSQLNSAHSAPLSSFKNHEAGGGRGRDMLFLSWMRPQLPEGMRCGAKYTVIVVQTVQTQIQRSVFSNFTLKETYYADSQVHNFILATTRIALDALMRKNTSLFSHCFSHTLLQLCFSSCPFFFS